MPHGTKHGQSNGSGSVSVSVNVSLVKLIDNLSIKTRKFAFKIVMLFKALPKATEAQVISQQFLRSGTSVDAHYREAKQSRSPNEFIAKIDLSLQELEETSYWLNIMLDCQIMHHDLLKNLQNDINELKVIMITMSKNCKDRK